MKLSQILDNTDCTILSGNPQEEVSDIEIDSRKVGPSGMFICIKGAKTDGHAYITQAIENGASVIVVEEMPAGVNPAAFEGITFVGSSNTQKDTGVFASNFYHNPANELTVIGVTGTKGKTTVVSLVHDLLQEAGLKVGSIGTLGIRYGETRRSLPNTTPDALTLQRTFREMADQGVTHVVMEASSQGFKLFRTNGFKFDIGVFLNIDRDHIGENEHRNFEEYLECKKRIFDQSKTIIVNKGDKVWRLLDEGQRGRAITFAIETESDYRATNLQPFREKDCLGMSFELKGAMQGSYRIGLPGRFNVSNTLAALAVLDQLGLDCKSLSKTLSHFQPEGRTEILKSAIPYGRTVLVDFAHNRLSIQSLLEALRCYHPHKIVAMFGLHWDETKMRRYDQGFAAGKYSDYAILTSDHKGPITFEEVNREVINGLNESKGEYTVIQDRKEAIQHALDVSGKEDIVVLIGMGNEKYQKIDGKAVYFSEEDIVREHLKAGFPNT